MREQAEKGWTYAKAGVDIAKEAAFIRALTYEGRGFASLVEIPGCDLMMAISTDGVGTKILVAAALQKWDTIGIDCVAMNVNDVLCVGANPVCFVDYIAAEHLDERVAAEMGRGLRRGVEMASVQWAGGETASLPEIVRGYDLSGTCVGVVKRERVIHPRADAGDLIIGIPSCGIHCNGLTLARTVVQKAGFSLNDPFPMNTERTIGEELLTPTRIYMEILSFLDVCSDVHGLAHITGGGFLKLKRLSDRDEIGYDIYDPLPPQPIFEFLQECGRIETAEMFRTFNCGMGFAVAIPPSEEKTALKVLKDAKVVGEVVRRRGIWVRDTLL